MRLVRGELLRLMSMAAFILMMMVLLFALPLRLAFAPQACAVCQSLAERAFCYFDRLMWSRSPPDLILTPQILTRAEVQPISFDDDGLHMCS